MMNVTTTRGISLEVDMLICVLDAASLRQILIFEFGVIWLPLEAKGMGKRFAVCLAQEWCRLNVCGTSVCVRQSHDSWRWAFNTYRLESWCFCAIRMLIESDFTGADFFVAT